METQTTRQKKVARLLEKDLSDIFRKDLQDITQNGMITVTKVIISPDLGHAKVYLSPFLIQNQNDFIQNVQEASKLIRLNLGRRVRLQLRVVPALHFFLDNTQEETDKINKLLSSLDIPPESPETDTE